VVSGRPILTVGDDVDAFCRVLGEDNVARLTREKICYCLACGFVVLCRLLGQAMRSPSVVASIAKEVLVHRLDGGLRRLASRSVIKIHSVLENREILPYRMNVIH